MAAPGAHTAMSCSHTFTTLLNRSALCLVNMSLLHIILTTYRHTLDAAWHLPLRLQRHRTSYNAVKPDFSHPMRSNTEV